MVSIIIPTLNESKIINQTLEYLTTLNGDTEILVADGGSKDDTLEKVGKFEKVKVVRSATGRALQMNEAAKYASGNILLFLHADTLPPADAIELIKQTLHQQYVVAGSFFLRFEPESPMLRFFSQFTRLNSILLTYGDQGLFLQKTTFDQIGGFQNIPLMEDTEIQQRLRKKGKFVKIQRAVTTSSRRYQHNGVIRQQLKDIGLAVLYFLGFSPSYLKKFYCDEVTESR